MPKILLIGNPNVGKSTAFNSMTKSDEHTGNFHGVTVDIKSKTIRFENTDYQVVDLPGIYSLNTYSFEEEISKKEIIKNKDLNFVIADANSLKKNLYLCQQLNELNIEYKLLINNVENYKTNKNKINLENLQKYLNIEVFEINAKKIKINKKLIKKSKNNTKKYNYLQNIINKIKLKINKKESDIILALNGFFDGFNLEEIEYIKSFNEELVKARYNFIDNQLLNCIDLDKNFVYGYSKIDKFSLNPIVMIVGFLLTFFLAIYLIFFTFGSRLSEGLTWLTETAIVNPIMNLIINLTDNVWIIEFLSHGVFSAFFVILSFLPQVVLMFVFITLLEDSGIISRMAYVFDDFLSKFGLNGKAIYILLLGLGCNTMSTMVTRNMNDKNLKTKTAILNPYISCMARLPVFIIIASTFFSKQAYFIIAGLYILGFIVALILGSILNKTILKSKSNSMLLEFPPMRKIDFKHIIQVSKTNAVDMLKRLTGVIVSVNIIVWLLTHTDFTFKYTQNIGESILFFVSSKISFLFAPIGLNNSGIVCALIVGIMAKELIVSTLSICNNASNSATLIESLVLSTSVVCLTKASAISLLIFSLLYFPCTSNIAVLKQETDKFTTIFAVITQFTIAYVLSFIAYQSMSKGIMFALISIIIIAIIMFAITFIIKKAKQGKCLTCGKCK